MTGTAAAGAGPDEVVELAGFVAGLARLVGKRLGAHSSSVGGGRGGNGALEGGDLFFGGADGGGEGCEAGEEVGV